MNIFKKIKTIFRVKGEEVELEADRVTLGNGIANISLDDTHEEYEIMYKDVQLIINPLSDTDEKSIVVFNGQHGKNNKQDNNKNQNGKNDKVKMNNITTNPTNRKKTQHASKIRVGRYFNLEKFKKKSFTIKLYEDEHELVYKACKQSGYTRDEYIMACVKMANQRTMSECKRIAKEHAILKEEEAKILQELN